MNLLFRAMRTDDTAFVIDSWVSSYRDSDYAGVISADEWPQIMARQAARLINRRGSEVTMLVNPDGTPGLTDLIGWILVEHGWVERVRVRQGRRWIVESRISETPLVHYLYVKNNYRTKSENGSTVSPFRCATKLMEAAWVPRDSRFTYTCKTEMASRLRSKIPLASWRPQLARFENETADARRDTADQKIQVITKK